MAAAITAASGRRQQSKANAAATTPLQPVEELPAPQQHRRQIAAAKMPRCCDEHVIPPVVRHLNHRHIRSERPRCASGFGGDAHHERVVHRVDPRWQCKIGDLHSTKPCGNRQHADKQPRRSRWSHLNSCQIVPGCPQRYAGQPDSTGYQERCRQRSADRRDPEIEERQYTQTETVPQDDSEEPVRTCSKHLAFQHIPRRHQPEAGCKQYPSNGEEGSNDRQHKAAYQPATASRKVIALDGRRRSHAHMTYTRTSRSDVSSIVGSGKFGEGTEWR
jgi:hypothetical protein